MRLRSYLFLFLVVPGVRVGAAPAIGNAHTRLEAIGLPGAWTGAKLISRGATVAGVSLGASGRWRAREVAATDGAITFSSFDTSSTGGTPTLGPRSHIRFSLSHDDPFPRVSFRLDFAAFDVTAWEEAVGTPCPVHFLSAELEQAEIYYFHGLLAPTPRTDPYPFSWRDMRANWADGWSTAPAISALTVPAVALWRPSTGHVLAYSFQHARSTDQSDRSISVAYRWPTTQSPTDSFTLIWPSQRGWNELAYPEVPSTVRSHLDLLYSLETGPTQDVSRLILDHTWSRYQDLLPTVPRMNDLGWMVERQGFPGEASPPGVFGRINKADGSFCTSFFRDGTRVFGGSFRDADLAYRRGDSAAVEALRRDVRTMLEGAEWETVGGDECCRWRYPFEGSWEDWIGGPQADTVHNVQQFGFGGTLLAMYVHERDENLWRYVEGLYRWARQGVYTRGDICDIPCSMFTLQTSQLALNFLLNLHYALLEDPDPHKREIAREAFDLAVTIVWRNANMTTGDPDPTDTLDPTFLMPGNHARFWLGQVSWAELCDVFRSLIVMYVETGDPRMAYYVRGALDKWHTGFEADGYHTAENLDVAGETAGKGVRTGLHGPQDSFWEYAQPVGDTVLHVTGGRAAAIAFCRGTTSLDVTDYRFRAPAGFAFRITGAHPGPFRMVFSSPFRDLTGLPVTVDGEPLTDVTVAGAAREHLLFAAKPGATVEIGEVGDRAVVARKPVLTHPSGFRVKRLQGAECLDLGAFHNVSLSCAWSESESWAGLSAGLAYAHGVPYIVGDPEATSGRVAVARGNVPIGRGPKALVLVASRLRDGEAAVELSDGALLPVAPEQGLKARDGLPLRGWELWLYPVIIPPRREVSAVRVRGEARVFAVTLMPDDAGPAQEVAAKARRLRDEAVAQAAAQQARDRMVAACRDRVSEQKRAKGALRAGFLPPHGPAALGIRNALQELGLPSVALRPEELVDARLFSAADYPILIYTGPERYLRSVRKPHDGEEALLQYLRDGGALLVMGPARPFTYAEDLVPMPRSEDPKQWVLFGRRLGLDLLGPGEARSGAIGFEEAPVGPLRFCVEVPQDVLSGLPDAIPFPATGDRRYRPATREALAPEDEFVPVLTLRDAAGTSYGPAISLVRRRAPGAGGNLLHVWGTLIQPDFAEAETVLYQVLAKAAEICRPASRTAALESVAPPPLTAAVGLLPLADADRAEVVRRVCARLSQDCADVSPDAFVDSAAFASARVPVAVHAPGAETYVKTWRLPRDGEEAYVRYVERGGFLIACGNATQFWYPAEWRAGGWEWEHPVEPTMPKAIGLPILYGFERPAGRICLELASGQPVFTVLGSRTNVSFLRDQRWRGLMPTRAAGLEFTPLAYLTDEDGRRYEGCAAALIRRHSNTGRGGAILYLWGNLLDGDLAEPLMRDALAFALRDVQHQP